MRCVGSSPFTRTLLNPSVNCSGFFMFYTSKLTPVKVLPMNTLSLVLAGAGLVTVVLLLAVFSVMQRALARLEARVEALEKSNS